MNFTNVSGGTASISAAGTGNTPAFTSSGLLSDVTTSNNFVQGYSYAFAAGNPYLNDAAFAFRVVSVFDPTNGTSYTATAAASSYGTTGTVRYDEVTISANPGGSTNPVVPEPASLAMVGLGGLIVLAARRRARLG